MKIVSPNEMLLYIIDENDFYDLRKRFQGSLAQHEGILSITWPDEEINLTHITYDKMRMSSKNIIDIASDCGFNVESINT